MNVDWDKHPYIREIGRAFLKWRWRAAPFLLSRVYYRQLADNIEGKSIWSEDWDLLVILDTCRPEWLRDLAPEYLWIESVDEWHSVASHSKEFVEKTFQNAPPEIDDTAYITANPYAEPHHLDLFEYGENVLKYDGVEYVTPTPPAHVVTDRAVTAGREQDFERMIVHYMQPHHPFYRRGGERDDVELVTDESHPEFLRSRLNGFKATPEVYDSYYDNLRYVLDEVEVLRENFDAERAIITSDHGQALGEGFCYDHIVGMNHSEMRLVPWARFSAFDTGNLEPDGYTDRATRAATEEQLESLGYL